ncbi:MAG TPA: AIPR family protein [Longimicrobium sp.]|nr:AIPR family protein [Longimicrobium sp.]
MSTEQDRFAEFLANLRSRVNNRVIEVAEDDSGAVPIGFREEAFTQVALEMLEDLGQISGGEICYFDRRLGRSTGKLNAWNVDEENGQVDLFTTIYRGLETPTTITATDLSQAIRRAAHVYGEAHSGIHEQMEPASPTYDMVQRLHQVWHSITRLRVIVIADGIAAELGNVDFDSKRLEIRVEIWDFRRLFRLSASGLPYEATKIDLVEKLGAPLPCLPMPESGADYGCYLAIIPGALLHSLYHAYGPRLLELNVRSFLQARAKVNRGIRDTLKTEPARFLAYNNGISATAEHVEIADCGDGVPGITRITGLQIVNGGQTVASIHRARERDHVDLKNVYVQAKLSIVRPEHIETLVPLISRYANTQNKVNEADFSANHPFHVRLQQLSETIWTPGEQSRWFYERARGQYEVARSREGDTPARLRRFELATPPRQRFDKVDLAKYLNAWGQFPHFVSKGGQKNFVHLMERLAKSHRENWEPDPEFFRQLIAQAIIFRRAEKVGRQHAFPGYTANAVAYTVSLISYRTAGRLDLEEVWQSQGVSTALEDTIREWLPQVHSGIIESAGSRNVTEWAKKEECWRHIQTLPVSLSPEMEVELAEGQPLPTVGDQAGQRGIDLTPRDRENIARVMQLSPEEWIGISGWGARSNKLQAWQIGIATTLAGYAATGWVKVPSKKQALQAIEILRIAEEDPDEVLLGLNAERPD